MSAVSRKSVIQCINLILIFHQVRIIANIRRNVLYQSSFHTISEICSFQNKDISQISAAGTCLEHCVACYLRRNNIQFHIETIFDNLIKPAALYALIVCRHIIDFNRQKVSGCSASTASFRTLSFLRIRSGCSFLCACRLTAVCRSLRGCAATTASQRRYYHCCS